MTKKKNGVSFDGGPVGYKRPPADHQFKPGHRPKGGGRPKGSRNYATIIEELLDSRFPVTVNGKTKRIPAKEALLRKAFANAFNGSTRDILKFFELADKLAPNLVTGKLQPIPMQWIPGDDTL